MNIASTKPYVKTIIVIPMGPNEPERSVLDTIASIQHYLSPSHKIIVVDNSRNGKGERIRAAAPDIDVVHGQYVGMFARLYLNISLGTAYAWEHYTFDTLIRMDADALITGPLPDEEAIAYFTAHPNVGQLGVYITDYNGRVRKWWPVNALMLSQAFNPLSWLLPRWRGFAWRTLFMRALRRGYKPGVHIYGGGFFLSHEAVRRLYMAGHLTNPGLADVRLAEDHITSVAVMAEGLDLADFASGDYPCAERWIGLPASPQELYARRKKLIHSVRHWDRMNEDDIRGFFRERRQRVPAQTAQGVVTPSAPSVSTAQTTSNTAAYGVLQPTA
jgi:hypothetical protein